MRECSEQIRIYNQGNISSEEIISVNSSSMQRLRNFPGCAQGPSMISWLRGLGSSLHRDCLTLQTLTGSGSTEGSSFGPNVAVVLEVQPGHSQGLGQASTTSTTPVVPLFGRAGSHHGALATTLLHPGLRPWWARLALSPCLQQDGLAIGSLSGPAATPWPWAGRTPTRPRHGFWFSGTMNQSGCAFHMHFHQHAAG